MPCWADFPYSGAGLSLAELAGGEVGGFFEDGGELLGGGEAEAVGDLFDGEGVCPQVELGGFDFIFQNISIGGGFEAAFEESAQMFAGDI